MSVAFVLKAALAAGISITVDGEDLILDAAAEPPARLIEDLCRHKRDLLKLLKPSGGSGWTAIDWLAFFDERAGVAEFDGGMSRADAEASAFECCVAEWMNRTHISSDPTCCHYCRKVGDATRPLLPLGTDAEGHTWLHSSCWPDWIEKRQAAARAALAAMGIVPSSVANERGGSEA